MNRLHSAGKTKIVKIFETRGTCSNHWTWRGYRLVEKTLQEFARSSYVYFGNM